MSDGHAADDLRHPPSADPAWEESWWFDFSTAGGELGGFVSLTVRPGDGSARFRAALVGDERRYLLVRDDDVRAPAGVTPEIRGEGLWSALECETPGVHWTVGLEAFAVALDDPFEAWAQERGDRVGLGFDLEWETAGEVIGGATDGSVNTGDVWYPCVVSGEVLIGADERLTVDAAGWRSRAWGMHRPPAPWLAGVLDRGGWLSPQLDEVDTLTDLAITPRHPAPLLEGGVRVRFDLCGLAGPQGSGRAWRCMVTEA